MSITGIPGNIPHQGIKERTPPELHISRIRSPTASDNGPQFKIGDIWVDTAAGSFFVLLSKEQGVADWAVGGGAGSGVLTINTILPDGAGDFSILGGTNVTVTPGVNSITISSLDVGATSFPTDSGTANEAAGVLNVLGGPGIDTSGAANTVSIVAADDVARFFTADAGSATPSLNTLAISGGLSMATSAAGSTVTISIGSDIANNYPVDNGGPAVSSSNSISLLGPSSSDFIGSGIETHVGATMDEAYFENRRFPSAFVVDASATVGNRGEYTTLTAAAAAMSAGDTMYVRPGTYTENWTPAINTSVVGLTGPGEGRKVIFDGTTNAPVGAGTTVFHNISGGTAGAVAIECQGGVGSNMIFYDCDFTDTGNVLRMVSGNCEMNRCRLDSTVGGGSAIAQESTAGSTCTLTDCVLTAVAGSAVITQTTASTLTLESCEVSGGDEAVSANSGGTINIRSCQMLATMNIEGMTVNAEHSLFDSTAPGSPGWTLELGSIINLNHCRVNSGVEQSFEVNANSTLTLYNMTIDSGSGGNWIDIGVGSSLDYGNLSLITDVSMGVGGTITQTGLSSSFHAFLPATVVGGTGAGAVFTLGTTTPLTERFDTGNNLVPAGTFTAPVTGTYEFTVRWVFGSLAGTNDDLVCDIVATGVTYEIARLNIDALANPANQSAITGTALIQMTAGDTATFTATETGGAAASVDIEGSLTGDATYVMGRLINA